MIQIYAKIACLFFVYVFFFAIYLLIFVAKWVLWVHLLWPYAFTWSWCCLSHLPSKMNQLCSTVTYCAVICCACFTILCYVKLCCSALWCCMLYWVLLAMCCVFLWFVLCLLLWCVLLCCAVLCCVVFVRCDTLCCLCYVMLHTDTEVHTTQATQHSIWQ